MNEQIKNLDSNGRYKSSTRVIVPGCQGGISQIHFGDYDEATEVNKSKQSFKPSTRVNVPGCQGGISQIKFGNEDEEQQQEELKENNKFQNTRLAGKPNKDAAYKPTTRVTQQPGGNSSIFFG